MMTIDEAIKHEEEVAESKQRQIDEEAWEKGSLTEKKCLESAKEHRQLAEWLRQLQAYRDERVGCEYCKHKFRKQHERPCSLCKHNFLDMFESEVNADDCSKHS